MNDLHNGKLLSVVDAILYVLARYWDPLHLQNEASRRGAQGWCILEACQSSSTPSGSNGDFGMEPGVSLPPSLRYGAASRSTPGYYLASLRLAPLVTRGRTRRLHWMAGVQFTLHSWRIGLPPVKCVFGNAG
jgi:hypothetical protein